MSISPKKIIFDIKTIYLKKDKDYLPNQNIPTLNFQKRNKLVKHAVLNTKFYKEKYKNSFSQKLESELEFEKLPILTRQDIKNNFSDIVSNKINAFWYTKIKTSGSTGIPITVLHDRGYSNVITQWRLLHWWGIYPYDNKAFIYRYPRTILKRIFNTLLWWPTRRIFLASSDMDQKKINKYIDRINKIKPTLLQGYLDVVYEFALYLHDNNLKIHKPKAVWVTASPMTDLQRNFMQKIFNAPVYDQYGCSEIPFVSAECRHQNGLHIMQDLVHLECVDDNNKPLPPGQLGRILLTDLNNYAFPLIRYEIGDYGRLLIHKCSCGIAFPLMDNVRSRKADYIETPSGQKIYGDFLTTIFDSSNTGIREFQIVQNRDLSVTLNYVPFVNKNVDEIVAKAISKLDLKANSELEVVTLKLKEIPKSEGKKKLIIKIV